MQAAMSTKVTSTATYPDMTAILRQIFSQGEPADAIYFVQAGRVKVSAGMGPEEKRDPEGDSRHHAHEVSLQSLSREL
jgi:hypothetical protein